MPTVGQAPSTQFLMGFETTPGTLPATPPADKLPVSNLQISPSVPEFTDDAMDGTTSPREWVGGKFGADGSFDISASRESMGFPLKGFFGLPTTYGGAGWYDHYFSLGASLPPSFYAQQGHLDIGTYLLYLGNQLGTWRQQMSSEGLMKSNFGIVGLSMTPYSSSQISGTVTDRTGSRVLNYVTATLKEGGSAVAYAESVEWNVDQKLERIKAMDGTRFGYAIIRNAITTLDVTLMAHYIDNSLLTKGINETETSLEVSVPAVESGHGFHAWLPTGKYLPTGITASGQGKLSQQLRGKFYGRGSASDIASEVLSKYFTIVTITGASNDSLVISVNGGGNQTFTLTPGSRTPANIVTDLATLTGAVAVVEGGRVVIRNTTLGTAGTLEVKAASTADTPLGFHNSVVTGWRTFMLVRLSNAVASYA